MCGIPLIILFFINLKYCNESIVYETLILIDRSMECYGQGVGQGTIRRSTLRKCINGNKTTKIPVTKLRVSAQPKNRLH